MTEQQLRIQKLLRSSDMRAKRAGFIYCGEIGSALFDDCTFELSIMLDQGVMDEENQTLITLGLAAFVEIFSGDTNLWDSSIETARSIFDKVFELKVTDMRITLAQILSYQMPKMAPFLFPETLRRLEAFQAELLEVDPNKHRILCSALSKIPKLARRARNTQTTQDSQEKFE